MTDNTIIKEIRTSVGEHTISMQKGTPTEALGSGLEYPYRELQDAIEFDMIDDLLIYEVGCQPESSDENTILISMELALVLDHTFVTTEYGNDFGSINIYEWMDSENIVIQLQAGAGWIRPNNFFIIGLKADGTCVATGANYHDQCNVRDWTNIIKVVTGDCITVGIKSNGTCVYTGIDNFSAKSVVENWTDIVDISFGVNHVVGLKSNGYCVAYGDNTYGQCDVNGLSLVTAIACGSNHTLINRIGLGIEAYGDNREGQCNIGSWGSISKIACCFDTSFGIQSGGLVVAGAKASNFTDAKWLSGLVDIFGHQVYNIPRLTPELIGLKSDTSVVCTNSVIESGYSNVKTATLGASNTNAYITNDNFLSYIHIPFFNDTQMYNVLSSLHSQWNSSIEKVFCGRSTTIGVTYNSTGNHCFGIGRDEEGSLDDLYSFAIKTAVCCFDDSHVIQLYHDGSVESVGDKPSWADPLIHMDRVEEIDAGYDHILGLKADGTCVANGSNANGQCNVSSWENIIQIACSEYSSFGLQDDGQVVYAGVPVGTGIIISSWTDVIFISGSQNRGDTLVAINDSGSVLCTSPTIPDIETLTSVGNSATQVVCCDTFVAALREDETVKIVGGCSVRGSYVTFAQPTWTNVSLIACGRTYVIGKRG